MTCSLGRAAIVAVTLVLVSAPTAFAAKGFS